MPAKLFIAFRVLGEAQSAGSKNAYAPLHPKTKQPYRNNRGGIVICVVDSCKKSGPWKTEVKQIARDAMKEHKLRILSEKLEGNKDAIPLKAVFRFYKKRPQAHFRTGKFSNLLRDDAPKFPTVQPDVLKLARAVEDALSEAIYKDDSAIVDEVLQKRFGRIDCVDIEIYIVE